MDERYTGVTANRRKYDIKCLECPFVASQLHKYSISGHNYDVSEAKFKESEIRVFYLWTQKEKQGILKPLPC